MISDRILDEGNWQDSISPGATILMSALLKLNQASVHSSVPEKQCPEPSCPGTLAGRGPWVMWYCFVSFLSIQVANVLGSPVCQKQVFNTTLDVETVSSRERTIQFPLQQEQKHLQSSMWPRDSSAGDPERHALEIQIFRRVVRHFSRAHHRSAPADQIGLSPSLSERSSFSSSTPTITLHLVCK
jgi:hypothetical protein